MKYIYGPVQSRRLGLSLGVTLIPHKTCTFNCVYCQLGRTSAYTSERKDYLPINEILSEVKSWLEGNKTQAAGLSYITLSGAGEPTLNRGIEELILGIKSLTTTEVALITNASLLRDPLNRRSVLNADLIVPSLDAATPTVFERIDRPAAGIRIEDIIEGLVSLHREFKGKLWLEVMLVRGANDDIRHIRKLKAAIDRINPDKIQLNSPVRSTAEPSILPVSRKKLEIIKELLGEKAEII
ncbi:MAG: radical SAM protein [Candidatus Omnitrophica bacterium]|nr:radical SAM protein [Candidatus Omnitrophota bacterium]